MEPLDVASTDWIKDYDPLFELFDEEMQSGEADAATLAATSGHQQSTWSSAAAACETYLTPISDYYYTAASFAATSAPIQHQRQQAYHATITASASGNIGTTPTTSYPGYVSADGYDLSQYIFTNQQCQHHNQAIAVAFDPAAPIYANSGSFSTQTTATNSGETYATTKQESQQQQQAQLQATDELSLFLGLDWLPSLENELTTSETSTTNPPSAIAPLTPSISLVQSETSSSSSSAYSSLAPSPSTTSSPCDIGPTKSSSSSKKRKGIRSKGTSLLAQPSPKLISVSVTNDSVANDIVTGIIGSVGTNCNVMTTLPIQISTAASITTATITTPTATNTATASTPARLLTKSVPILQLSRSAKLQRQSNLHAPVTTTTATLLTYSNIANIARQNASSKPSAVPIKKASALASRKSASNETEKLTGLQLTSRLCVKIEHDYAMPAR